MASQVPVTLSARMIRPWAPDPTHFLEGRHPPRNPLYADRSFSRPNMWGLRDRADALRQPILKLLDMQVWA
jgi:hypothetical protein